MPCTLPVLRQEAQYASHAVSDTPLALQNAFQAFCRRLVRNHAEYYILLIRRVQEFLFDRPYVTAPRAPEPIDKAFGYRYNTVENGSPPSEADKKPPEAKHMKQSWFRRHLNELLFGVYLFVVLAIDLFCNHFHWMEIADPKRPFLTFLLLLPLPLFLLIPPLFYTLRGVRFKAQAPFSRRKRLLFWLMGCAVTALLLLPWCLWACRVDYLHYVPDCVDQLSQAVSGVYSDWHPVWHTLLFFTLPLRLFGTESAILFFNCFLFLLAMGCCFLTLCELGGLRYALISVCAILLNPVLMKALAVPWKDTAFSITSMLAAIIALRYWCLEKDWTHSLGGTAVLGLLLANATLFRHNGILFTSFLLLALLFVMKKKNWAAAALTFALFLILVKGPVYSALDVEKPGRRTIETMGLPLTVIGNVVTQRPELLDDETRDFAFSVTPLEIWQRYYVCGNFNAFKFRMGDEELELIDAAGPGKILRMMFSCFRRAPLESCKGLFCLTDLVYGVSDTGDRAAADPPNVMYGSGPLIGLLLEYSDLCSKTVFQYFGRAGTTILIMLAAMLSKCSFWSRSDWKRILLCLSIFCYDFGTMLLLTGADARFFLVSFLVCPIFTLLLFYEKDDPAKEIVLRKTF